MDLSDSQELWGIGSQAHVGERPDRAERQPHLPGQGVVHPVALRAEPAERGVRCANDAELGGVLPAGQKLTFGRIRGSISPVMDRQPEIKGARDGPRATLIRVKPYQAPTPRRYSRGGDVERG